jgi:hypothetical protein
MKIKNIGRVNEAVERYKAVSTLIEDIISKNEKNVDVAFPRTYSSGPTTTLAIPRDKAETLLFNEKNRLERELAGLGVEV